MTSLGKPADGDGGSPESRTNPRTGAEFSSFHVKGRAEAGSRLEGMGGGQTAQSHQPPRARRPADWQGLFSLGRSWRVSKVSGLKADSSTRRAVTTAQTVGTPLFGHKPHPSGVDSLGAGPQGAGT